MSRREDIDNAVWSDPDFAELTPQAKLIYLWSFTNPRCGMAGLYKVSRGAMHLECTMPPDQVDAALAELEAERFLFFDGRVMWVRTRVKHLRTRGQNMARSIRSDLERVGLEHPYVQAFCSEYGGFAWLDLTPLQDPPKGPAEPSRHPAEGVGDPSPTPGGTLGRVPGQGQGQGQALALPSPEEEEEEARVRDNERPNGLHPQHGEVMAILEATRAKRPGVVADDAAVLSALMAHRTVDAVSAAHVAASQIADGTARTDIAPTVLRWALRDAEQGKGGGGRGRSSSAQQRLDGPPTGRGSSAALARASQRDAEQREQRRRAAEEAGS